MAEAGPWDKFAPPERPAGPWDKFAPDDEPGVAEDVAKSAAIGLPKGVMKLAGTAGDLRDLAARGGSALAEQFGYDVSPETISKYARRVPLPLLQGPTSSEIRSTVEKATGPLYEPKTVPGQYAQTVTEMVPAALGGPGGWARRLIQGAVVPGIGSEAAGQFTEGTAAEPYARMIGAVGPQAAALGARGLLVSPRGGAVKPADVALLEREGVRDISAGQKTGSTPLQYLEQSLGDVTGAGTRMTERGKEQFTQAVLRRAGIDAERATPEVIDDAFKRIGNQFDRLAANNTLHPDQAMGPQIRQAVDHYNGNVSPPNRAPVIRGFQEEIAQALGANNGVIPGPAYASLRSRMEAAARSAPAEVADTLRGVKNALDHAMERHLERIGSSDLGAWQQVRREYRNILPIERAVTGGGGAEGLISPSALRAAMVNQSRRGYARGTGDLSRLAKAGENVMKPLPQSGTAPRAYMMSLPASVGAIGGGVMTGNPLLLGGGLLGALGPPIGGRALMSRPVQNFFANPRPFNYAPVINTIPGMAGGGRPTGPTVVGEDGPEVFVPDRPGTVVNNDEVRRYLRATTQDYPKFGPGGIPVNPEAFTAAVGGWPESGNVEDRRPERAAAEAEAARAAAAARTGRRGRAEGAGTRFVEGGYGIPAAIGSLNEGARKAMESAGALQHYGNEYYDPAPVVAQALGAAGAPLVAPAMEGAVLGAGAIRRAAIPQTAKRAIQEAPYPQYAEAYPPNVEGGVMKADKTSGKPYRSRLTAPETDEFMGAREKISEDMKGGYDPYYDPAKRTLVDPSKYPGRNVDTLEIKPARQSTIDTYLKDIDAPITRERLRAAYERGKELGNADNWYFMGQLENDFVKELGPKEGRKAFLDRFASGMAATTSGQSPTTNYLMSHYLNYLEQTGKPMPKGGWEIPAPVSGQYMMNNVGDYMRMRREGGYAGLGADQPKMHNFARSFVGDLDRAVMDDQMAKGMLSHSADKNMANNARKTAFGLLEAPLHAEAAAAGVRPGAYQDVAWAGFKNPAGKPNVPGKPMISHINDAIERTHRLTGMPKDEIVRRGIIRNEIPVYGFSAPMPTPFKSTED